MQLFSVLTVNFACFSDCLLTNDIHHTTREKKFCWTVSFIKIVIWKANDFNTVITVIKLMKNQV